MSFSLSFSPPVSALLSLALAAGMGTLGVALGERLLALLRIRPTTGGERVVLAGGLGLGALGYGFLALGLIGLLRPSAIGAMLALAAVWAWPFRPRRGRPCACPIRATRRPLRGPFGTTVGRPLRGPFGTTVGRPLEFFERLGVTLIIAMLAIVLVRGLAPVTDYDGLAYHLVVPRDYLQAGRVIPYPGEAHFNFPLTVDLLYIPAILLGLESAARLIHLCFGVLMSLGVYTLAQRLLGSRKRAWLALFVLGTTPVIGTVGGYAHTDLGWALFEFLAAYSLLCWMKEEATADADPRTGTADIEPDRLPDCPRSASAASGEKSWLVLAGIFAGLGLGSKYLGLPVLGVLGLVLLIQQGLLARRPWRHVLVHGLLFGSIAAAVAAPWYLKNWLWLGNPVYPLWFGGKGWDAYLAAKLAFMGTSYGPRRGPLGFLLLPWDLFRYSIGWFGPIPFAFPTPLSLLLPLYLLVRRRPVVNLMLLISLLRFGTWAISARSPRYLMDTYPLLSVAVAYLLSELARNRGARPSLPTARGAGARTIVQAVVFVMLVGNLAWQALLLVQEDPFPVLLGRESREHYLLDHNDPPYRTIRFINQLPAGSRVLFSGNGQSYYVTADHVADVNHSNWGHLVHRWGEDLFELHRALRAQGFTHIYYSGYDFDWQLNFDTEGQLAQELAIFDRFVSRCASLIHDRGEDGQVYALLERCEE